MSHDEPVIIDIGFKSNRRGGLVVPSAQQRLHPPDCAVKRRTPGLVSWHCTLRWYEVGKESLPITGGCHVSSQPRGGRHCTC